MVNGTTFPVAAWSMFLYFSSSSMRLRDIARLIMADIRSGNIEILFSKPVSYLYYRSWWQIGLGIYSFVVITPIGAAILGSIVGFPETMKAPLFIPTLFCVVLLGILLTLVLHIIIGLLAFWIEDINPIFWIVDKAVMILGGSYLPVAMFPSLMYKMALYSPFGASLFVTHTVYASWQSQWSLHIGIQIFWVVFLSLVMYGLFVKARRRVSVNGG